MDEIMTERIDNFRGENYFLSNFYPASVTYNGYTFMNSEAAFQAQKCKDRTEIEGFTSVDSSTAKKMGRRVKMREDWDEVRVNVMHEIVRAKFIQNPELRKKLLETGNAYLEEGNTWGDRFWGTVDRMGENHLGRILMEVRDELSAGIGYTDTDGVGRHLIVLERTNGWYGGYVLNENGFYEQVFNTNPQGLFFSIKDYTDKGYTLTCLDASKEEEFMKGRPTLLDSISAACKSIEESEQAPRYKLVHRSDWGIVDTVTDKVVYSTRNQKVAEDILKKLNNGSITMGGLRILQNFTYGITGKDE